MDFVNDQNAEEVKKRPHFQALTPLYPEERILLETEPRNYSTRIMDLVTPIGLGQRGLIVAPPKAGKTSLLKEIANAIITNKPEAKLFVLLVGERPEEVTDIERSVESAEVVHSVEPSLFQHVHFFFALSESHSLLYRLFQMIHFIITRFKTIFFF